MGIFTKILGWAGGILSGPWGWVVKPILDWILAKIKGFWTSFILQREKQVIADHNVEKDKEALEKGDLDEIAKSGEDLLNGKPHNP